MDGIMDVQDVKGVVKTMTKIINKLSFIVLSFLTGLLFFTLIGGFGFLFFNYTEELTFFGVVVMLFIFTTFFGMKILDKFKR
jgi:hypothetical protein